MVESEVTSDLFLATGAVMFAPMVVALANNKLRGDLFNSKRTVMFAPMVVALTNNEIGSDLLCQLSSSDGFQTYFLAPNINIMFSFFNQKYTSQL